MILEHQLSFVKLKEEGIKVQIGLCEQLPVPQAVDAQGWKTQKQALRVGPPPRGYD